MSERTPKVHGVLARFDNPAELLAAARSVRDAGYTKTDCHSPFVIHGMDEAMGLRRSSLGWIVGLCAFLGGTGGLALQWWTSAVEYPLVISGKPFFSFQAYVPVTFALAVILAAFAATIGMILSSQLPRLFHWVFYSDRFTACDDGFFISIETDDPKFDCETTRKFLESIGGQQVEVLKG